MTTRQATLEEALRMIAFEAWCEQHGSARHVASQALGGELFIDISADGGMGRHVCAECLEIDLAGGR